MLRDYFGKSDTVLGIELFPISVLDWEIFEKVAYKYLPYGYNFINYKIKSNDGIKPFDVVVSMVAKEVLDKKSLECESILELQKMFSLALKKETKLKIDQKTKTWSFVFDNGEINRDNYDQVREVIMRQNLIFEPLLVEDEYTQKIIDKAIKVKNKSSGDFSLQSMVAYVCNSKQMKPLDLSDYTYYQLRCDNEMCQRLESNQAIHLYRSQGAKAETINVYKGLETLTNPYSWDKFFSKIDGNSDMEMQNAMKN